MDISSSGATVENGTSLTGNPAVSITGENVTFVNRSGGSVVGYAAIAIRAAGATIVNEAGAVIRGAPDPSFGYRFLAIDGSEYADTVINRGSIVNDIKLHGGDDRYEVFVSPENNVTGNPVADLGAGDDLALFHVDNVSTLWGVDVVGGEGYDTLRVEGIGSLYIATNVLHSVERLVLVGSGPSSYASIGYLFGAKEIVLSQGLTFTLGNGGYQDNPDAQVYLNGGNFYLWAAAGAVTGSDAGERLEVSEKGSLTGGVSMGGGGDRVSVEGKVGASIDLGAGNDVFDFDGSTILSSGPQGTTVRYSPPGSIAGTIDGGSGDDLLSVFAIDGRTIDLTPFVNFESLEVSGSGKGDVRLTDLGIVTSVTISVSEGTRIAIADSDAPDLELAMTGYSRKAEIVVESTATIGGITRTIPLYFGENGTSSDYDLIVRNDGAISGDVHLWLGNDRYDGRLGSVGGTVFGHSGSDAILLGAGDEAADGGSGDDLVEGNGGADRLDGAWGDDVLRGGDGDDSLTGGGGRDTLYGGGDGDLLTDLEGNGDALYGEGGDDVLELVRNYWESGGSSFTLDGGDGDDRIHLDLGDHGHADIDAGAGADLVVLDGLNTANVRLGDGADTLFLDRFIAHSAPGTLRILDFTPGEGGDRLDLADRPLLREAFINWDGASDLFAAGLLRFVQKGPDAWLEGDIWGWGFTTLLILADTDAAALTAANLGGWTPVVIGGPAGGPSLLEGTGSADHLAGGRGDDSYIVNDPGDRVSERSGEGEADEVRTGLADYALPAEVEILTGTGAGGQALRGNGLDNRVAGGSGNDLLDLRDGGADLAFAGGGNDVLYFGTALGAGDVADGGAGRDALVLQGNVTLVMGNYQFYEIESLSLQSGANAKFGDTANNYYDFDVTMADGNVAAGQQLIVNAQSLRAGEDFTFDGSAESDGRFLVYGGHGVDDLTGGAGVDVFFFEGQRWGAGDRVDGGAGRDALVISGGDGLTRIAFGADSLTGIESISLNNRYATDPSQKPSYELVLHNGNVAPGGTLIVNGSSIPLGQAVNIDGSTVRDGNLILFGGGGNDILAGGAGGDTILGGSGADRLAGGAGADVFRYDSAADSTAGLADLIGDFLSGTDRIDLGLIDANTASAGDQAFSWIGSNAFSGAAGELRTWEADGYRWVAGDTNGDGAADLLIALAPGGAPFLPTDFLL